MSPARAIVLVIAIVFPWASHNAVAQRANDIDALAAQMNEAARSGRQAEGLALAQKLEGLVRRQQGTGNMNYAGVLHNEGMFLQNLGRYPEAVVKLNAALAIKLRNNDAASTLRTSNILIASLGMLNRRAEASAVAERALAIGTRAFGPEDVRLTGTLAALGGLARDQENYREAERYFERALAGRQKSNLSAPFEIASSMDDLGDLYGLEGRFDDGERLIKQGLALLEQTYGADATAAPNYDKMLNDLGNLYKDAGRFAEAEKAFQRALAAGRMRHGEDHPNVAATMGNLATVLEGQSRFSESEDLYKKTLAVYERLYGSSHALTAIGLNNLANVYADQGRTQDAAGLQQRVVAIQEKAAGPDSPEVARALNNLANSYRELGRRDEALPLYERALRIMQDKFGRDGGPAALAFGAMGRALHDSRRFGEAAQYLDRALKIDERVLGPEHPQIVNDLRGIALLDLRTGNLSDARTRLERALRIAQSRLGPHHHDTIATLINLADVDGREKKWPDALAKLREASAAMDRQQIDGRDKAQFKGFTDLDTALVEAIWRTAGGNPDESHIGEAFAAAQRVHETQAGAALAQMAARFGAGDDAIAAAVRRQQDLKATLDSLDKRITTELGTADGKRNDDLIARLRAESSRARQSFEQTSAQIAHDFPGYAELSSPAPLSLSQAKALLKPDEALLSFLSMDDKSYVFAVTRETAVWREIPLGSKGISDQVGRLRLGLFDPAPDAAKPFDLAASYDLYAALIGPVETAIAGKAKLLVVPTGALTSLPFHVLVTKKPDPASDPSDRYRQAAWLLNDRAITVLPTVSSLRALRVFAKTSRATRPFIGFGDPQLQRPGAPVKPARSVQPYQSYYSGTTVDIDRLRSGLPALPETANELRAVARDLGATDRDVNLGPAATVTAVKSMPLDQYRVVDFATHGLVAGEVGGLSEPALVLTLPDRPTAEDDGLLTASRIARLRLDADWAVLSACNTAAGDKPGAEGLSGLARAFFYAGARSLLVSHWPVDSAAAVKLTTGAFGELKRNPAIGRAEALRRSMQALIADRSSERNADPSVWAPFVLVGEGG